ncbi:MAG: alpha/beta hydrolase family protein [Clostridia bacterium]
MKGFPAELDRRMRRWQEQRWILDAVIRTVGVEWDQARIAYTLGPCGPSATADFMGVRQRVQKFADISREFERAAVRRRTHAERAGQEGRPVAARESYFIASLLYGSAQWPLFSHSDENLRLDDAKVACYGAYAGLADHPVERVDIPFGQGRLPGWLHLPAEGRAPYPVVLAIDGMDGFKEMMVALYGDALLTRGMAVLALDGPGQGEALTHGVHLTADNFRDVGREAVGFIRRHPKLDAARVAVSGVSFGSYFATLVGAEVPDLKGVAVAYVCHEPGGETIFQSASPTFKLRFMYMAGMEDEDAFDAWRAGFTLEGVGREITAPYLCIAGEEDDLSPIEYTYALMDEIRTPKELLLYEGERHGLHTTTSSALGPPDREWMAEWLHDRLVTDRPAPSRLAYVDLSGRITDKAWAEVE